MARSHSIRSFMVLAKISSCVWYRSCAVPVVHRPVARSHDLMPPGPFLVTDFAASASVPARVTSSSALAAPRRTSRSSRPTWWAAQLVSVARLARRDRVVMAAYDQIAQGRLGALGDRYRLVGVDHAEVDKVLAVGWSANLLLVRWPPSFVTGLFAPLLSQHHRASSTQRSLDQKRYGSSDHEPVGKEPPPRRRPRTHRAAAPEGTTRARFASIPLIPHGVPGGIYLSRARSGADRGLLYAICEHTHPLEPFRRTLDRTAAQRERRVHQCSLHPGH